MGCHCRPDRSFHLRGWQFPVCARCTGILCGFVAAIAGIWFGAPKIVYLMLMLAPMIADGAVQRLAGRESNNPRRFITGALWGYAAMTLLLLSFAWAFRLGHRVGRQFLNR